MITVEYGFGLFFAFVYFAFVGLIWASYVKGVTKYNIIYSAFVGQVLVFIYIYLRSTFNNYVYYIPVTVFEFYVVPIFFLSINYKNIKNIFHDENLGKNYIYGLVTICVIALAISHRELPKLLMLSSDPDQHAFFAKQIMRFGTIPYHQFNWGNEAFNYPAGSGVFIYIWSMASWLDVRNTLSALTSMQLYMAAFLIAEYSIYKYKLVNGKWLIYFLAFVLVAYAFPITLYIVNYHFEGTGRQLSLGLAAFFVIQILTISKNYRRDYFIICMTFFFLVDLNPINAFVTALIYGSYWITNWKKIKFSYLLISIVAALFCLLLDPYYLSLFHGGLTQKDTIEVLNKTDNISAYNLVWGALESIINNPLGRLKDLLSYYNSSSVKILLLSIFPIIYLYYTTHLNESNRIRNLFFILFVGIGSYLLIYIFAEAFSSKSYYLLFPYFLYSLSQYKFILIVFLFITSIVLFITKYKSKTEIIIVGLITIYILGAILNSIISKKTTPRNEYCGAIGCYQESDIRALNMFSKLPEIEKIKNKKTKIISRILLPNIVAKFPNETWLFPYAGARLVPFYNVLPAAFFYYQGDSIYTFENYMNHVCDKFDKQWLISHKIDYVFIPAKRGAICIGNIDNLINSNKITVKDGNTYILKLTPNN